MISISIIGIGRVGGALVLALPPDKYAVEGLYGRTEQLFVAADIKRNVGKLDDLHELCSDVVIITTPDQSIGDTAALIAARLRPGTIVLHTSGALSSTVLSTVSDSGCRVGSIHPLISISTPELGPERVKGAYFCIEGDPEAVALAEMIAHDLGGVPFKIDTAKKPLYHAAAVMASGHIVAQFDAATELMTLAGPNPEFARKLLLPLIESTVKNLSINDNARALTGTFARADLATFEKHIEAIRAEASEKIMELYLALGERSLDIALLQGADPTRVEEIRKRIFLAKSGAK